MTVNTDIPPARYSTLRSRMSGRHAQTGTLNPVLVPGGQMPRFIEQRPTFVPNLPAPQVVAPLGHKQRKSAFHSRFRAVWDWFRLSALGTFFAFLLLANGMLMTKVLIILWQELLGKYVG